MTDQYYYQMDDEDEYADDEQAMREQEQGPLVQNRHQQHAIFPQYLMPQDNSLLAQHHTQARDAVVDSTKAIEQKMATTGTDSKTRSCIAEFAMWNRAALRMYLPEDMQPLLQEMRSVPGHNMDTLSAIQNETATQVCTKDKIAPDSIEFLRAIVNAQQLMYSQAALQQARVFSSTALDFVQGDGRSIEYRQREGSSKKDASDHAFHAMHQMGGWKRMVAAYNITGTPRDSDPYTKQDKNKVLKSVIGLTAADSIRLLHALNKSTREIRGE